MQFQMGLTIHFSGAMDRVADLPKLVDELTIFADSMGWLAQAINMEDPAAEFRGVLVNPQGRCEPLRFIFDREGRVRNFMDLLHNQVEPNEHSFYSVSETEFAPVEAHLWIVGLLRYVGQKYISTLHVGDEGDYWKTDDLKALIEKKAGKAEEVPLDDADQVESLPDDITIDELVKRIEEIVKRDR